jgi:hypothetical protein
MIGRSAKTGKVTAHLQTIARMTGYPCRKIEPAVALRHD